MWEGWGKGVGGEARGWGRVGQGVWEGKGQGMWEEKGQGAIAGY